MVGQQPQHQPHRIGLGPDGVHGGAHRPGPPHRLMGPVVAGLPGGLHPGQDDVGDPVAQHLPAGGVADPALTQFTDQAGQLTRADPPAPRAADHDDRLGGLAQARPQGPVQHRGHPGVPLDLRGPGGVGGPDRHPGQQVGQGRLGDVDLAESGQHVADIGQEGAVRPDDQDPAPGHPRRVGVQQVGDPVQADRGLPGAGGALHAQRAVRASPDDVVLVRRDGGHDVAHRPGPRPLDLLDEDAADRARRARGRRARVAGEHLVLVRGELATRKAEPPAQFQPHRVGRAGPVERPGHRGPPVDHDRMPFLVVHVPPAHVEPLPRELAAGAWVRRIVQPAEEQRRVRQVAERLHPPVQVGFQVLLGDGVAAQGPEREHVLAHQPEEPPRLAEIFTFPNENRIGASVPGTRGPGSGGRGGIGRRVWLNPAGRGHGASPRGRKGRQEPTSLAT